MKARLIYTVIVGVVLLFVQFITPFIFRPFIDNGSLSVETYRLINLTLILLIAVGIAGLIINEGKYTDSGIKTVGWLMILGAIMDFIRVYVYPTVAPETYVISFFSGLIIFGFSLVSLKKAILKRGAGLFLVLLGFVYMVRFPIFIDLLFFYYREYSHHISPSEGYYLGTLYANYVIILIEIIALNVIILENEAMARYVKL